MDDDVEQSEDDEVGGMDSEALSKPRQFGRRRMTLITPLTFLSTRPFFTAKARETYTLRYPGLSSMRTATASAARRGRQRHEA
jgi:hypothetical protein